MPKKAAVPPSKKKAPASPSEMRSSSGSKPLENWDIDVMYAVVLLFLCGFSGKAIANAISNDILAIMSIGFLEILLPIVISFVFSQVVKAQFKDEKRTVNSTPLDFIFSIAIVVVMGILFRGMIGKDYLLIMATTIIGMVVAYIDFFSILKNLAKKK